MKFEKDKYKEKINPAVSWDLVIILLLINQDILIS